MDCDNEPSWLKPLTVAVMRSVNDAREEYYMHPRFQCLLMMLAMSALPQVFANAQSRKLGPATADSIQEAKLDPAFQTTKLDRVALLPFANTSQYKDPAAIISKKFVSQLSQLHAEYKFVPPEETINFISTSGLNDEFNVFLGDYLASGTARKDFLDSLRNKLQIDAVLVGHITAWGDKKVTVLFLGKPQLRKMHLVGVDMSLYRTTDGRRIWYGKDLIAAQNQGRLQEAAEVISDVFARFFGRTPY